MKLIMAREKATRTKVMPLSTNQIYSRKQSVLFHKRSQETTKIKPNQIKDNPRNSILRPSKLIIQAPKKRINYK